MIGVEVLMIGVEGKIVTGGAKGEGYR